MPTINPYDPNFQSQIPPAIDVQSVSADTSSSHAELQRFVGSILSPDVFSHVKSLASKGIERVVGAILGPDSFELALSRGDRIRGRNSKVGQVLIFSPSNDRDVLPTLTFVFPEKHDSQKSARAVEVLYSPHAHRGPMGYYNASAADTSLKAMAQSLKQALNDPDLDVRFHPQVQAALSKVRKASVFSELLLRSTKQNSQLAEFPKLAQLAYQGHVDTVKEGSQKLRAQAMDPKSPLFYAQEQVFQDCDIVEAIAQNWAHVRPNSGPGSYYL